MADRSAGWLSKTMLMLVTCHTADDKLTTVKKGVRSLFRSRSQRRGNQEEGGSTMQGQSGATAFEAPNSTATPQLTTSIPGASLGAELPRTQPRDVPGANEFQEPPPPPPIVPRASYAEGMSATSGPLGGSLEEVEEFEKLRERRASVRSSITSAAGSATRRVEGAQGESPRQSMEGVQETQTSSTSTTKRSQRGGSSGEDTEMSDAPK